MYFEQLTPLVILSTTAEETDESTEDVQEQIDDNLQGGEGEQTESEEQQLTEEYEPMRPSDFGLESYYKD